MRDDIETSSKAAFLTSLERLMSLSGAVTHEAFEQAFERLPGGDFSPTEWDKIVEFAAEQLGRWQVEWHFSPALAPDASAAAEMGAWRSLWQAHSAALVQRVPEVEQHLVRQRDLAALRRALERREQYNRGDRIRTTGSAIMSHLAISFNRVGLGGVGRWLYTKALYPAGTVGRAQR